jgi:hypothetical protein
MEFSRMKMVAIADTKFGSCVSWHFWHWAGCGGGLGFGRGVGDLAPVGVAAVAVGDIHLCFTWQASSLVISISTLLFNICIHINTHAHTQTVIHT